MRKEVTMKNKRRGKVCDVKANKKMFNYVCVNGLRPGNIVGLKDKCDACVKEWKFKTC